MPIFRGEKPPGLLSFLVLVLFLFYVVSSFINVSPLSNGEVLLHYALTFIYNNKRDGII